MGLIELFSTCSNDFLSLLWGLREGSALSIQLSSEDLLYININYRILYRLRVREWGKMGIKVGIYQKLRGFGSFFAVLTECVLRDLRDQTFSGALLLLEGLNKMVFLVLAVSVL